MNTDFFDVSIERCSEYKHDLVVRAITRAAEKSGFPSVAGKTILVKPNILNASAPEKAVTTHPVFLAAVLQFLQENRAARIIVGDSPGFQQGSIAGKTAGLYQIAMDAKAEWDEFKQGSLHQAPEGRLVKSFVLADVLERCDLVINLPKLKTHRLMNYTGAIKNLFGLIPGLAKSAMHLRYPDKEHFGTMLVDLALSVVPTFTFMDAIAAMEGEGPGNGTPYPLGLVLASASMPLLDWTAASIIGYKPEKISYLADAMDRIGKNPEKPEYSCGPESIQQVRVDNFKLLPYEIAHPSALKALPGFLQKLAVSATMRRPIFHEKKCIGCSACVKICPGKALILDRKSPGINKILIDDAACITCFCCHEVCPVNAISAGKVLYRPRRDRKLS